MKTAAERGISQNSLIAELTKSPHGKLEEYLSLGTRAAVEQPEFMAHLIAWNQRNGQIRDSKKALPIIALTAPKLHEEFRENSLAHFATLNPRELLGAYQFALQVRPQGSMTALRRVIARYLHKMEADRNTWNRNAVQHRDSLQRLYSLARVARDENVGAILFRGEGSKRRGREKVHPSYPRGSVFEAIANLKTMGPTEIAGTIASRRIPFLVASVALQERVKEPDVLLAIMGSMTATEVVTNAASLEKWGAKSTPALKSALEAAMGRVGKNTKANVFKTSQAIEAVDDEGLKEKLRGAQEKQIASMKGIEGNWLVLGDASGSMAACVEGARHVAGTLSKLVRGKVMLVFFNTTPRVVEVTGMDYEEILKKTKHVEANGGTSIGCGLLAAIEKNFDVDGIAIVSDAAENTAPFFSAQYAALCQASGKQAPVYLYRFGNPKPPTRLGYGMGPTYRSGDWDLSWSMQQAGFDLQEFDLTGGKIDYYGLPAIVQTMRANRYSLSQEIMDTPLLTLDQVLGPRTVVTNA